MLTWKVKNFDFNKRAIVDYDVLKYKEDFIKKLKKKCESKYDFSKELEYEFRWQYWSRSEYELIISIRDSRVILSPWAGCRESEKAEIDVTDDTTFNWLEFADIHIDRQLYRDKAKIDIFDQLQYRWEDFVDYCWHTRLPYERKNSKFERK